MKKVHVNLGASVRARLQNIARETNRPFAEVVQYYGMERFLYRLSRSVYTERFTLKGALLFTAWDIPERRTTMDIDLSAQFPNEVPGIEDAIKNICTVETVPDGLEFDAATVQGSVIKEGDDYKGVRIKLVGFLERVRIPMQIDLGFGDAVHPGCTAVEYPAILDFPRPCLQGYPAVSVISEKFEAMVALGSVNSRMKDFYDLWLMMRMFDIDGRELVGALVSTFKRRNTEFPAGSPLLAPELYDMQSDRQQLWTAFINKGNPGHAPESLGLLIREMEDFLGEPLAAIGNGSTFDCEWSASGPWKPVVN